MKKFNVLNIKRREPSSHRKNIETGFHQSGYVSNKLKEFSVILICSLFILPVILLSQPEKDFDLEKTKNSGYSHEGADIKRHISQESRKYLLQKGDFTKVNKDINRIEKNRVDNNVTNSTYFLGRNGNTMDMNISNPRVDGNYFKFEIQIRRTNTWESGFLENALGNVDFYFDRNADAFTGTPSYEALHTDLTGDNYTCIAQVNAGKLQFAIYYVFQDMNFLTPTLDAYETVCTMVWEIADPNQNSDIIWDQPNTGAQSAADNAINLTYYGSGDITLPVELSAFTVQFLNGVPTLYWRTMSETDNIGWYVYRNKEEDFTTAERITDYLIEGYGTTTEPHDYIYKDVELNGIPGETYWYWIQSVDLGGRFYRYDPGIVMIQGTPEHYDRPTIPIQYGLHQNKPNPLCIGRGSTKISFILQKTARAEVKIYNIRGELVKDLYNGIAYGDDEVKDIIWDGRDENGVEHKTGIYLYQLKVNGKPSETKRLILMR